jgi:hypothetical protein
VDKPPTPTLPTTTTTSASHAGRVCKSAARCREEVCLPAKGGRGTASSSSSRLNCSSSASYTSLVKYYGVPPTDIGCRESPSQGQSECPGCAYAHNQEINALLQQQMDIPRKVMGAVVLAAAGSEAQGYMGSVGWRGGRGLLKRKGFTGAMRQTGLGVMEACPANAGQPLPFIHSMHSALSAPPGRWSRPTASSSPGHGGYRCLERRPGLSPPVHRASQKEISSSPRRTASPATQAPFSFLFYCPAIYTPYEARILGL